MGPDAMIFWMLSFQLSSVTRSYPTLCNPLNCSTPGLPVHHQLQSSLRLMSIESLMPSSHLILCHPLLLLPPIPPIIRVFSNESVLRMRWPKYWSFSFSIILSKEHPGLISFRMDWFDLLAAQGTLKSLLQKHISKASILWHSAFCTVQLLHPYMTTGKTIALTRWTFVGKVMSLLFNMLSRLVKTFLPRRKHLLISWLQSPSAVIPIADIYFITHKSVCLQCRRPRFNPWFGKIPWRKKWQLTPVSLPGESHGQRSLSGCSPWGHKESDTAEKLHFHFLSWKYRLVLSSLSNTRAKEWHQSDREV